MPRRAQPLRWTKVDHERQARSLVRQLEVAEVERDRYREALEYIAEPKNWSPYHRNKLDSLDKRRRAAEALNG